MIKFIHVYKKNRDEKKTINLVLKVWHSQIQSLKFMCVRAYGHAHTHVWLYVYNK